MPGLPPTANVAVDRLRAEPAVRRIILFGSRAVGDEEERSDIDLAVSAPDLDGPAFTTLRDAVANARTLYRISLARLEDMPVRLRDRVVAQGLVIHERS